MQTIWERIQGFLPHVLSAGLILILGLWLSKYISRLINRLMDSTHIDRTVKTFLHTTVRVVINIIVIISAASTLGIPVSTFVGMASATTVAIGLAFRDSLSNVAAGILLMLSRPFAVGDNVIINGNNGIVQSIEIMYSTMLTFDNKLVVMPNSSVIASTVTNISARPTRRLELTYSIDAKADVSLAMKLIKQATKDDERVLSDPAPTVAIDAFGKDYYSVICYAWCYNGVYSELKYALNGAIADAFSKHNIALAATRITIDEASMANAKEDASAHN